MGQKWNIQRKFSEKRKMTKDRSTGTEFVEVTMGRGLAGG